MKIWLLIASLLLVAAAAPPLYPRGGQAQGWKGEKSQGKAKGKNKDNNNSGLLQLPTDCGKPTYPPKQSRIVGGVEADPHSWPWMIRLYVRGSWVCGGSLITKRHVVTAAHCLQGKVKDVQVVLGDHSIDDPDAGEVTVNAISYTNHPDYNSRTIDSDIAVITLEQEVATGATIHPICMPGAESFNTGDAAYTTGWGSLASGGSYPDKLRQVKVDFQSRADCRQTPYGSEITDTMVCAGVDGGGKDACQGDSGGPLACKNGDKWYLCGVVSWGYGCGDPNYPGVYADSKELENWVTDQLRV